MNKYLYTTLKLFTCCLFASTAIAEDNVEKIEVGTRPISHIEWLNTQQTRAEEAELELEDYVDLDISFKTEASIEKTEGSVGKTKSVVKTGTIEKTKSAIEKTEGAISKTEGAISKTDADIYYTSHNGAFHNPYYITVFGETVELEDGSVWKVANGDTYKTLNWLTSDLIVVTPNHEWFSSFMFRMTNQNTNVSVKCNLILGPVYNGVFTHWIVSINYYTHEIWLEDGSIWQITGLDSSTFSKWFLNDTVIIGVNDGFLNSSKPNILINVNTLTYVRANCIW